MKRMLVLVIVSVSLSVVATLLATWISTMARPTRHEGAPLG
jgi:hypothetical protein